MSQPFRNKNEPRGNSHCSTATAANSTRLATKQVPRGIASPPASSADTGVGEIGSLQVSDSTMQTTTGKPIDRQTYPQSQTDRQHTADRQLYCYTVVLSMDSPVVDMCNFHQLCALVGSRKNPAGRDPNPSNPTQPNKVASQSRLIAANL